VLSFFFFLTSPKLASEPGSGSVLVLGADPYVSAYVTNVHGSGFIVKIDEERNAAYVLTAHHLVENSDRIYVLYDRMSFPFEYVYDLEDGIIPEDLSSILSAKGYPEPTHVRRGIPKQAGEPILRNSVYFATESLVLSGSGQEYLVLPQAENLELYCLLPATLVHQSDAQFDLALLVVYNFPQYENKPVLYMDTPAAIADSTSLFTSGCRGAGISPLELQTRAFSSDSGFVSYTSPLIQPGFAGAPMILGEYVVAINMPHMVFNEFQGRARLACTFKDLVDSWIGLPRMRIDLVVDSPDGAKDGSVSTGQTFTIISHAVLDPNGQVLAPVLPFELNLPPLFTTEDDSTGILEHSREQSWAVTAPHQISGPLPLKLQSQPATSSLAELFITTEEGTKITGRVVKGPSSGSTLFLRDDITVGIKFELSGSSVTGVDGIVTVRHPIKQFEILGHRNPSQPFELDKNINWRLRTQETAKKAPILFALDIESLDRNGKPIDVELPEPIRVRIKDEWKHTTHLGAGRYDFENGLAYDFEIGFKFRKANIAQKGFPLEYGFTVGAGLDSLVYALGQSETQDDEAVGFDYRYWASGGLTLGLGSPKISCYWGYMTFARGAILDETLAQENRLIPSTHSTFLQAGVDFSLLYVGFYTGTRIFFDLDQTEYFLQLRSFFGK